MAAVIWLLGAIAYLLCEAIAAARLPGYSYVHDYISDLGATAVMNVGFMVHGALFLVGAVLISRSVSIGRSFVIAAAANAIGNVLVGAFRSGVTAHTIGAGLAIVGGNAAAIIAGLAKVGAPRGYRVASVALGVIGLTCLLTLIIDGANGSRLFPVGIVERGSVYSITIWEIMTAVAILYGCAARKNSFVKPADSASTSNGRSSKA